MRKAVSAALLVLVLTGFARAQDISDVIEKVGTQYAKGYLGPAADAFGVDMNSGLFHTAKVGGGILPFGLSLYVGVKVGAALIPSSDQTFSMSYLDTVSFARTIGTQAVDIKIPTTITVNNAPTVFGDKNTTGVMNFSVHKDTTVQVGGVSQTLTLDSTGNVATIEGLGKLPVAAFPIPQIGIGSIFGTDIFIRYLPKIKIGEYGSVQMLGYGIRHDISQYIPFCPVDLAIQLGWQNFSASDSGGNKVLKESAFAANVEVSKTLAIVTFYGGLQVESSNMEVNYNLVVPATVANPNPKPIPISFSIKGKNNFRALVGVSFDLFPFLINADYNIGAVNSFSAGIGVSI